MKVNIVIMSNVSVENVAIFSWKYLNYFQLTFNVYEPLFIPCVLSFVFGSVEPESSITGVGVSIEGVEPESSITGVGGQHRGCGAGFPLRLWFLVGIAGGGGR